MITNKDMCTHKFTGIMKTNDLISRQIVINTIELANGALYWNQTLMENLVSVIKAIPAIEPVKRGEWKLNYALPTLKPFCSVCGKDSPTKMRYDYCPHCGAKMDGEE